MPNIPNKIRASIFEIKLKSLIKPLKIYQPLEKMGENPMLILIGEAHDKHYIEQEKLIMNIRPAQILHEGMENFNIEPGYRIYRRDNDLLYSKEEKECAEIDDSYYHTFQHIVARLLRSDLVYNSKTTDQILDELKIRSPFELHKYFNKRIFHDTELAKESVKFYFFIKWALTFNVNFYGADLTDGEIYKVANIMKIFAKRNMKIINKFREYKMFTVIKQFTRPGDYTLGIFGEDHLEPGSLLISKLKEKNIPHYLIRCEQNS